jgi:D-alanyl-D-alanine carboxypeptidase
MPLRPALRRFVATLARTGAMAIAGVALTVLAAGPGAEPAYAAKKKTAAKATSAKASPAADSRYAAIVVDSATGEVLFAKNADARRYPASLTKIMTLYVLFEEMKKGRITNETRFEVSAKASAQAPSKLGLKPGQTITALEAIRALVTKSANDAAMVVAENVSGSEAAFVARMNATAKRIGMMSTTFRNPNGLPNPGQVSTARDLATLGLAIQTRFPEEYKHFSTRRFVFRGATYGNHNRLLGAVDGVDGIKTGYIRASGFNLVTSVKRDGRQLVAVVMGGATGRSRDAHMAELVRTYLPKAERTRATQPLVASVRGGWKLPAAEVEVAAAEVDAPSAAEPMALVAAPKAQAAAPKAQAKAPEPAAPKTVILAVELSRMPVARPQPVAVAAVETVAVEPLAYADAAPVPVAAPVVPAPAAPAGPSSADVAAAKAQLTAMLQRYEEAEGDADAADAPEEALVVASTAPIAPAPIATTPIATTPIVSAAVAPAPAVTAATVEAPARSMSRDGWKIQIGALPSQTAASERLEAARDQFARLLAEAEPYTEAVAKGSTTLYRARFAGFETQAAAQAACVQIKKRAYDCLPVLQ